MEEERVDDAETGRVGLLSHDLIRPDCGKRSPKRSSPSIDRGPRLDDSAILANSVPRGGPAIDRNLHEIETGVDMLAEVPKTRPALSHNDCPSNRINTRSDAYNQKRLPARPLQHGSSPRPPES